MKIYIEILNLFNIGGIGHFMLRPKYFLFLPAILNPWTDFREILYWGLFKKIYLEIPNLFNIGGIGHFMLRPKYFLFLPAILNHRK